MSLRWGAMSAAAQSVVPDRMPSASKFGLAPLHAHCRQTACLLTSPRVICMHDAAHCCQNRECLCCGLQQTSSSCRAACRRVWPVRRTQHAA